MPDEGDRRVLSPLERQELRARIARQRRRVDRRLGSAVDHAVLSGSWREFVQQHPGRSILAAFGGGLLASGLGLRRLTENRLVAALYGMAVEAGWGRLWQEIKTAFATSADTEQADTDVDEDDDDDIGTFEADDFDSDDGPDDMSDIVE